MAHRVAPATESDLDDVWYYVAKEASILLIVWWMSSRNAFTYWPYFRIWDNLELSLERDAAVSL